MIHEFNQYTGEAWRLRGIITNPSGELVPSSIHDFKIIDGTEDFSLSNGGIFSFIVLSDGDIKVENAVGTLDTIPVKTGMNFIGNFTKIHADGTSCNSILCYI